MKKQYFLILKVLIIIILISIIYFIKLDRTDMYDIPINSYYSDRTYDLPDVYREKIQNEFLTYLNDGEYHKAFDMLSEASKNTTFGNSEEKFISYVKENIFNIGELNNIYNVKFIQYDIDFQEDVTEISYVINIRKNGVSVYEENDDPGIKVKLLEYSPFQYQIEIII